MAVNKPMMSNDPIRKTVEAAIRIGLLFLLLYWCYGIVKPFVDILIWAIIFGIALISTLTGAFAAWVLDTTDGED